MTAQRVPFARAYVERLCRSLTSLDLDAVARVIEALEQAWVERRRVFIAGNGGSAATASHMANDLAKTVVVKPGIVGFRAVALTDNVPLMTALANDIGYEVVFSAQLEALADAGDVFIAISGSGNSANIVRALQVARTRGLVTIGLLGRDGGEAGKLVDVAVVVPAEDYGPIEDIHLMLDHLVTEYFKESLAQRAQP